MPPGSIHPRRVADLDRVNHLGAQRVVDAAARAHVRRMVHVSSNSPFGTNGRVDDTFRQDEPYHPYLGYGESKMRGELAVREAHAEGRLDDDRSCGRRGSTGRSSPRGRPRSSAWCAGAASRWSATAPAPLDGVRRQPRPGCRPRRAAPRRGGARLLGRRRPAVPAARDRRHRRASPGRRGLQVSRRQLRLPAVASRVAEGVDRALQHRAATSRSCTCSASWARPSPATSPPRWRSSATHPAFELYDGMRDTVGWCRRRGSRCERDRARHRRQRLLRVAARRVVAARGSHGAGPRPAGRRRPARRRRVPRRRHPRRGGGPGGVRRGRRRVPQRRPGAAGPGQPACFESVNVGRHAEPA